MNLCHISKGLLIMFAGGDPWKINASLQKGQPGQISDLAEGFHSASRASQQADNAFTDARNRLNAWTHDNGQHPITDSGEAQRTAKALGLQAAQLPNIAVDLENIAAALAQAQSTAAGNIASLEARLQTLDDCIGQAEDAIAQDEQLIAESDDDAEIAGLRENEAKWQHYITDCEHEALDDTKATLQAVTQVREDYSSVLQGAESSLRAEGFNPAAIQALDADAPSDQLPGQVPRTGLESGQLSDLQRATDQAVVDQMAKVREAQNQLNAALRDMYTNGQGSAKGDAANAKLPELRQKLGDALDDLGKIPNYDSINPATMSSDTDGRFMFSYNVNGQTAQVAGQLKNGSGEFFDQGTGTYYTFQNGKLVGMRTPDPGQVQATPEPLWSAVTLAVGGPELKAAGEAGLQTLKAGGGRAWQGFSSLFGRGGAGAVDDLSSENVLPRAVAAAEQRANDAQHYLTTHSPVAAPVGGAGAGGAGDVGAAGAGKAVATAGGDPLDHVPPAPNAPAPPDGLPPLVPSSGPQFALDNPLDYMPPDLVALSEQHLTGSGETVLGPFKNPIGGPSYTQLADDRGSSYFDIGDAWYSYSETERLAANQHVLDIAIANRDTIRLSISLDMVPDGSYTAAELRYLQAHGYTIVDGNTLIPPEIGDAP